MTLVYFTDRDLGPGFARTLRDAGLSVEAHHEHFQPDCPDEEWLAKAAAREWVALTHNSRIRYTPNELEAVMRNRVRLLVIVGKAKLPDLARSFIATRSRIEAFLAQNAASVIAKVYRAAPADLLRNPTAPGRIERWYPK